MQRKTLLFGVLLISGFVFLLTTPILVKGQSGLVQTTQSPTPIIKSTAVPTDSIAKNDAVNSSQPQPSNDQVIELYKQAIEVSQNTVNSVHSTTNLVLTVVGVVFTALGLAIAIGTWSIGNTITKSADQLEKARDQLQNTQNKYETRTEEFEKRNTEAFESFDGLAQKQADLLKQIESTESFLKDLRKDLNRIQESIAQDRQLLKKPLTLMQIDDYGMQLLSGTPEGRFSSALALIEMSSRSDAVVRRKSVETLGLLTEYDERVVKRLKEIIESDPAQGVRKEAEKSLKLIEAKRPKKTTRRKS